MNIRIYYDLDRVFGNLARSWAKILQGQGHSVEVKRLGYDHSKSIDVHHDVDVNLFIAGYFLMRTLNEQGLPKIGRNVIWMFEPLTDDVSANIQSEKTDLFRGIAEGLDAFIGMNRSMVDYVNSHYPHKKTYHIPYTVDKTNIIRPQNKTKTTGVLFLASGSPRRESVVKSFSKANVPIEYVHKGLWREERIKTWSRSWITLQVAKDSLVYFDQYRTFEAWSLGSVVVCEPNPELSEYGVVNGDHLIVTEIKDMPTVCKDLLNKKDELERISSNAQRLLLEKYTPELWFGKMIGAIG